MKIKEIRAAPVAELKNKMSELRRELIKVNAQSATGTTSKNPSQARQMRRTISRILTVIQNKNKEEKKKA